MFKFCKFKTNLVKKSNFYIKFTKFKKKLENLEKYKVKKVKKK